MTIEPSAVGLIQLELLKLLDGFAFSSCFSAPQSLLPTISKSFSTSQWFLFLAQVIERFSGYPLESCTLQHSSTSAGSLSGTPRTPHPIQNCLRGPSYYFYGSRHHSTHSSNNCNLFLYRGSLCSCHRGWGHYTVIFNFIATPDPSVRSRYP